MNIPNGHASGDLLFSRNGAALARRPRASGTRIVYDWNDLKYLLAVARHGSAMAAARSLGVNQSTVQRRIADLEVRFGCALVERQQSGYRLTRLGEHLQPFAESVASAAMAFEHHARSTDPARSAVLRLTCPEPIAARLTESGFTDRFRATCPDTRIEFVLSDRYVDLTKGDADVALRSGDTDDGVLVGRKIADSIWAIYASRAYASRGEVPRGVDDLGGHPLIGFDERMEKHRLSVWLAQVAPDAKYAVRCSSVLGLVSAAKSGVGVAPLPVALGDAEADLIRVIDVVPELTRAWRILCHPDARQTRRVVSFFDFVHAEIESLKPILTG